MICHWSYDDGEPYYMMAIDRWSEPRRPCWRCHWRMRHVDRDETFQGWFKAHPEDSYDLTVRFNGGDPYISIEIYDETVATAFRLTWVDA
jgi:hypothetical protein